MLELHHACSADCFARTKAVFDRDVRVARSGGRNFNFREQVSDAAADIELADVDVGDTGIAPGFELRRTPDAAGDEAGTPIPSIFISGFADVGLGLNASLRLPGIVSGDFSGGLDGRGNDDSQRVRARLEVGLHIHSPFAKHVVGGEDQLVIEIDLGVSVEACENEVNIFLREERGRGLHRRAVFPVGVFNPLQLGFVVAVVGVGDQLVVEQVEMNAAGNCGGAPLGCVCYCGVSGDYRRAVDQLAEFPAGVQRDDLLLHGGCQTHGDTENKETPKE